MDGILLGVDIGTSSCKVAAFTSDGILLGQSTEAYETYAPMPGYSEQNPEDWWQAVCTATQRLVHDARVRAEDIRGIGVDGQSWIALPVDRRGTPLRNAMTWMDRRAESECEMLCKTVQEAEIFEVSGNPIAPGYTTGKILWIKEYEPEVYRQTHKFLQCNSYIVWKMTDRFTQDVSQGYGIHAFDIEQGKWDFSLCERMGINPALLPELFDCSEVVGELTPRAANECGLRAGTPVVAGGLDAACGTLGVGAALPGEVQEQGGQAGGMSIVWDSAVKHRKLILSHHVIRDAWLLQGGTVGGGSLKWLRREMAREFPTDDDFFQAINRDVQAIPPGSDGLVYLPYMAGERSPIWDVHAKGVFLGLSYEKTRAHLARSIMEGCAFALHHNLMTAAESGVSVDELRSMGGAANSPIWMQIKADVTGKMIRVPSSDTATTLGAAMLTGIGIGMYQDAKEAIQQTVRIRSVYEPNPRQVKIYHDYYGIYREAYERYRDLFPRLGGMNG